MVTALLGTELAGLRIGSLGRAKISTTDKLTGPAGNESAVQVSCSPRSRVVSYAGRPSSLHARNIDKALDEADILMPREWIPRDSLVLETARKRGIPILSEIELAYRVCRAPILAVSGTCGKSITSALLAHILRASGKNVWHAGFAAPASIAPFEAAFRAQSSDAIVMEADSFQLAFVDEFRPQVGILTNVFPGNFGWHRTYSSYLACKSKLFQRQRSHDVAVLNAINVGSREIAASSESRKMWFDRGNHSGGSSTCVRGGRIFTEWNGRLHDLCGLASISARDGWFLEDYLAAASAAIAFGIDPELVSCGLRSFAGIRFRMEIVSVVDGVRFVNNAASSSIEATVQAMRSTAGSCALITGGDAAGCDCSTLASVASRRASGIITFGKAGYEISADLERAGSPGARTARNVSEAAGIARRIARRGDTVLFSPCSRADDKKARKLGIEFDRAVKCIVSAGNAR